MKSKQWLNGIMVGILLMIAGSRAAQAQKIEAQPPQYINHVYIMNKGVTPLIIYYSSDAKNWVQDTLTPKAVTPYRAADKFYIKVYTTGDKYVQYLLQKGKKYTVEWNDSADKWDVFELTN